MLLWIVDEPAVLELSNTSPPSVPLPAELLLIAALAAVLVLLNVSVLKSFWVKVALPAVLESLKVTEALPELV